MSTTKSESGKSNFKLIDPLDPSQKILSVSEADFLQNWSGFILLISRKSGLDSQDRIFN